MESSLLRRLCILGPAVVVLSTVASCVYDPYGYRYYDPPPAYMIDPRDDGGPPPSRYRNRYGRYGDDEYGYGDRYYGRPEGGRRREHNYQYGPRGSRRGGTDYLREERDDEYADEERGRSEGEERDLAESRQRTEERSGADSPTQRKLNDEVMSQGSTSTSSGAGAVKTDPKDIKTATKAKTPGRVKSPYPPYNELDVSGLNPGSLAKDPTSGKVFRIP